MDVYFRPVRHGIFSDHHMMGDIAVRHTAAMLALSATLFGVMTPATTVAQSTVVDSQVVRIAFSTLVGELAPNIAAVVKDAPPRTWLITFPDQNPPAWTAVRAQLFQTLNGRPAAVGDTSLDLATVSELEVTSDSLTFKVSVGMQWQCDGHWRGRGTVTIFIAHRNHGVWQSAVKGERHVFDSDPC